MMGEELISEPYYCQLEAETCRVFSEQLGRFSLVGESLNMSAAKRLRLVLFSDAYCSTLEYNIRVYCMDDTQDVFKVRNLDTHTHSSMYVQYTHTRTCCFIHTPLEPHRGVV